MNNIKTKEKFKFSITNMAFFTYLKMLIAILIAFVITFGILCLISDDPLFAAKTILFGPLQKPRYIGEVIESFIPYAFAGLCCCFLFSAGFFNLGTEGIYIMSGLAMTFVAIAPINIIIVHPILCFVVAMVVGGLLMLIPAYLKAKFGASEMVLSLMLNSIYLALAYFIVRKTCASPTSSSVVSADFAKTAKIGYIISKYHISICLFVLIAVTIISFLVLYKTRLGYQIRLSGTNPKFADYSGINAFKLSMITNFIAGSIAGLGSACYLLTQFSYFAWTSTSPGVGFSGSLLAMLGTNNPIGTVVASFLIKYLEEGSKVLYYIDSTIPSEIISIVEGIVILFVSSQNFLVGFREKKLLKEGLVGKAERRDR